MDSPHPIRAFTIIEILVVIGIVALLVGILLPVLSRARGAAKDAICRSNMRQLVAATVLYQNDHRQYFPQPFQESALGSPQAAGAACWFNALDRYLMQAQKNYSSASSTQRNYKAFKQDPVWLDFDEADQDENRTIKMNEYLGDNVVTPNVYKFYKIIQIPKPSKTVLFVDGRAQDILKVTDNTPSNDTSFSATPGVVGLRHDKGANVANVDGAVAQHKNPILVSGAGFEGWYLDNATPATNRPDVIFNFLLP